MRQWMLLRPGSPAVPRFSARLLHSTTPLLRSGKGSKKRKSRIDRHKEMFEWSNIFGARDDHIQPRKDSHRSSGGKFVSRWNHPASRYLMPGIPPPVSLDGTTLSTNPPFSAADYAAATGKAVPGSVDDPANPPTAPSQTRTELTELYRSNPFTVLDFQDPDAPDAGMRFASRENLLLAADAEDNAPDDEFDFSAVGSGRHTFLQRGDLVQLMTSTTGSQAVAAIYIRTFTNGRSQFLTMNGQVRYESDNRVIFTVPAYFRPDALSAILPYVPKNLAEFEAMAKLKHVFEWDVPRSVAAPLLSILQAFWTDCETVQRKNALQLRKAHDTLADDHHSRFLTLHQVSASIMPQRNSPAAAFAVERALSWQTLHFGINNLHHRTSRIIQVRSHDFIRRARRVCYRIRDFQAVEAVRGTDGADRLSERTEANSALFTSFVDKARRLIQANRQIRYSVAGANSIGLLRPDRPIEFRPEVAFSDEDHDFIWFLTQLSMTTAFAVDSSTMAAGAFLIRSIGYYDGRTTTMPFEPDTGFLILQELGVIRPFENRALHDPEIALPGYTDTGPMGLRPGHQRPLVDSMAALRHDWGNLDVFCIDAVDAEEIDDGVSVERIEGSDECWVHVHVANPTAYFAPNTALGSAAQHRVGSVYLPEGTYNLLPPSLVTSKFSLENDRPALTFSARLSADGEIVERKVQNSTVRNVLVLTPEEASAELTPGKIHDERPKFSMAVGAKYASEKTGVVSKPASTPSARPSRLSPGQKDQLKLLHRLSLARLRRRLASGAVDMSFSEPSVKTTYTESWTEASKIELPDPSIKLTGPQYDPLPVGSPIAGSVLVREMMVLAGQVAGQWMDQHAIPAVYRISARNEELQDPGEYYRDVYLPACEMADDGATVVRSPPRSIVSEYMHLLGRVTASTTPAPHLSLGVDRYVKVTSPLRRYGDMIAHWQIEAHLSHQAGLASVDKPDEWKQPETVRKSPKTGEPDYSDSQAVLQSFSPSPSTDIFPFSSQVLSTEMLPMLVWRERRIRMASQQSNYHWAAQLFFRALHFNEAKEMPALWSVHVDPQEIQRGEAVSDTPAVSPPIANSSADADAESSKPVNPFELYQDKAISDQALSPALAQMSVIPIPVNKRAQAELIRGTLVENSLTVWIRIPEPVAETVADDGEAKVWEAKLVDVDVYRGRVIFEAVGLRTDGA